MCNVSLILLFYNVYDSNTCTCHLYYINVCISMQGAVSDVKWVDGHKPIFKVDIRLQSTIYTQVLYSTYTVNVYENVYTCIIYFSVFFHRRDFQYIVIIICATLIQRVRGVFANRKYLIRYFHCKIHASFTLYCKQLSFKSYNS